MKHTVQFELMTSRLFKAGILNQSQTPDAWEKMIGDCLTLRRLAKKHHRLAEMDCNGEGVIMGVMYSCSTSFPSWQKSAYLGGYEESIFSREGDKLDAKIKAICDRLGLRVEFQGDLRGYTVKVFKDDRFLDIQWA